MGHILEPMHIGFTRVALGDVHDTIGRHLSALPGPIDSFLEEHVHSSSHYLITVSGAQAGFASIHEGRLITQFSLEPAFQRFGQASFHALRRLESVRAAFVPTCDELFLAHALDEYRQLAKQAYFFYAPPGGAVPDGVLQHYSLRPATPNDEALIREQSGELFGAVAERIEQGELFLTLRAGVCTGFGVVARSAFQRNVASIGMFTSEPFRGSGVATATIALLLAHCRRQELRAVAGCWYYNHASKRTLERAGMVTKTRLLHIEY